MSIWNKILLVLVFLAALGFFHAATRTLQTYAYWADLANKYEAKLKNINEVNKKLRLADHQHPLDDKTIGVEQLRMDLGRVLANRGRIWKCERQKAAATPQTQSQRPSRRMLSRPARRIRWGRNIFMALLCMSIMSSCFCW